MQNVCDPKYAIFLAKIFIHVASHNTTFEQFKTF